jgi:hypothetical protein
MFALVAALVAVVVGLIVGVVGSHGKKTNKK